MSVNETAGNGSLAVGNDADLDALHAGLEAAEPRPLWTVTEELLTPAPRPAAVPWLWPASTMKPLAREAIRPVPVERGGERRVPALRNPGLGGRPYAAGTLWGASQCPGPYEIAPAHRPVRRAVNAIYVVFRGHGARLDSEGAI